MARQDMVSQPRYVVFLSVLLLSVSSSLGCALIIGGVYRGDGEMHVDLLAHPPERYQLRLGTFTSSKARADRFIIRNLPNHEFRFALMVTKVASTQKVLMDMYSSRGLEQLGLASVSVRVSELSNGRTVCEQSGRLSEWSWCDTGDVWRAHTNQPGKEVLVGLNELVGTSFTGALRFDPARWAAYLVEIQVSDPDEYGIEFSLEAHGGRIAVY